MRIGVIILLACLAATLAVRADELLPVLKVGTIFYTNVTVTKVTPTDIWFFSGNSLVNVKLQDLDPALQKHFSYDQAKAAAAAKAQDPLPPDFDPKTIQRGNAQSLKDAAIARVKAIVNQPVRKFAQTADMDVSVYSPGWFHAGAEKPDFKTVDIRTTRSGTYDEHHYVSSDVTPGVVFIGPELEFNSMTKFFYVDRSLPKKKLTEAEMLEINRLYRIIGACDDKLGASADASSSASASSGAAPGSDSPLAHTKVIIFTVAGIALFLIAIRVFAGKRTQ